VFSDPALLPWLDRLREEVPRVDLIDAHTHIGANDPDGYRCTAPQLLEVLETATSRGVVFPMHEPGGYPPANDVVLEHAADSGGRLAAFCRLDPAASPLAEAERCLPAGANGIKLHPRAEGFTLDHPALREVFELADDRRLPVLVHAGRGIPALGRHAVEACERHPGLRLILAHAGICDLAWIWQPARDLPNLLFDTAWWSASDLQTLLALVGPGQVLYASDAPYGSPTIAAVMAWRHALQLGLSAEQVCGVMGGQLERVLAHEDLLDLGPAPGAERIPSDPLLDRVYAYLMAALGQMFNGLEPAEILALTAMACDVDEESPQALVCRAVLALVEARTRFVPAGGERPNRFAPGIQLVVLAAAVARTPDVPLPAEALRL